MPQNLAATPEIIYNTLTNDATFMTYVGTYTFAASNTELDSITVNSPGTDLPHLKAQSGLEVIIHDVGDTSRLDWLTGESNAIITWKVFLIAWPPATGYTVSLAAKRMIEIFSKAVSVETVAVSDGLGALVQTMVTIPSDSVILL